MPAKFYRDRGTPVDIIKGMLKAKLKAEKRFGKKSLMENVKSDWDWGFVSGKLSAIRWVLEKSGTCLTLSLGHFSVPFPCRSHCLTSKTLYIMPSAAL